MAARRMAGRTSSPLTTPISHAPAPGLPRSSAAAAAQAGGIQPAGVGDQPQASARLPERGERFDTSRKSRA